FLSLSTRNLISDKDTLNKSISMGARFSPQKYRVTPPGGCKKLPYSSDSDTGNRTPVSTVLEMRA
ncbi:hypothetical protein BD777DRAFT_124744, partial [Yarrowia lipolytica]